jgi:hypothetical protein
MKGICKFLIVICIAMQADESRCFSPASFVIAAPSSLTASPGLNPQPATQPPCPSQLPPSPVATPPPAESVPDFVPFKNDIQYPKLPHLRRFTCTFHSELHTFESSSVLLVTLRDGSRRLLKIFFDFPGAVHPPFTAEYEAYAALLHHRVSLPPDAAEQRVVPFCYGSVILNDLKRQIKASNKWDSTLKAVRNTTLYGLVLEYIPNSTNLAADPGRLVKNPGLLPQILQALDRVHEAGIMHILHAEEYFG